MTKKEKKEKERLEVIRKRLEAYKEHCNDAYAYFEEEIEAVRELRYHAPEDIEFLLKKVDRLIELVACLRFRRGVPL